MSVELSRADVLRILGDVMDPEIPVISVVDLGIVRHVDITPDRVKLTITPTYSGCPAMRTMEQDMREALHAHGVEHVEFETVYAPAWTSDWIPEDAKERLRGFGIAPPESVAHDDFVTLTRRAPAVPCPYCGSANTEMRSPFGATSCKALHFCNACHQPFEHFKAF